MHTTHLVMSARQSTLCELIPITENCKSECGFTNLDYIFFIHLLPSVKFIHMLQLNGRGRVSGGKDRTDACDVKSILRRF